MGLGFCGHAFGMRYTLRPMAALPDAWDSANAGRKTEPLRPRAQNTMLFQFGNGRPLTTVSLSSDAMMDAASTDPFSVK